MFSESPELYDLIYGSFKDYETESSEIAGLLARIAPEAGQILDVGCGTGEHARHLRRTHGYEVDGLDLEPGFIELAQGKMPGARFWCADMAEFSIDATFDAVICLFSSIGYLPTTEALTSALSCFRAHLRPGGVVVVEPWFEPGQWQAGRIYAHTSEAEGIHVVRMSHSRLQGRTTLLTFHYLVGTENGIEHRTEPHEMTLFTRDEMIGSFAAAGFADVDYDPVGPIGRGLYTARLSK